jgi:hypothetical protein
MNLYWVVNYGYVILGGRRVSCVYEFDLLVILSIVEIGLI